VRGLSAVVLALLVASTATAGPAGRKKVPYEELTLEAGCSRNEGREARNVLGLSVASANRVQLASAPQPLRKIVGCPLSEPPDFRRVRVAVFRYVRFSAESYRLVDVLDDGTKIRLTFHVSHVCQGIAQQGFAEVAVVAIPKGTKPVVADVEHERGPECGRVP
jgi:hypothetical protein